MNANLHPYGNFTETTRAAAQSGDTRAENKRQRNQGEPEMGSRKAATSLAISFAVLLALTGSSAVAGPIEVFHADSLAGPMRELKKAFEAKNKDVTINLSSGVSKQLAERILQGDVCDVFAPSSPAVIDQDLMNKQVVGSGQTAASWYVVFSANEMAVITAKGTRWAFAKSQTSSNRRSNSYA
jgi:ABC-type molybdate transport system substrate-binding protein